MSAKDTSVPLYEQVKRSLRDDINKGVLAPGQLLPGQRELAERHNVSDITVRRALQDLAREKLVSRVVGVGTFVRTEIEPARIALLLPSFDDFNLWRDRGKDFGDLMAGIGEVVWEYCAMLSVIRPEGDASIRRFIMEQKAHRTVDGVLLKPNGEISPPIFDLLDETNLPFVVINRRVSARPVNCVFADEFSESHMLTTHLIEQGYSRIGFIAPPPGEVFQNRYGGYVSALRGKGIPLREELVIQAADYDSQHGSMWVDRLLDLRDPPDAIFLAMSAYIAPSALAAIAARGIRIPEDMAFVMHDSDNSGESYHPSITSAGCSYFNLGREAAVLLTRVMKERPSNTTQYMLPPHVVIRNSTPFAAKRSAA